MLIPLLTLGGEDVDHETSILHSERVDTTTGGQTPTRVEHSEIQSGAETQAQHVVNHIPGV